jgi:hypothetical protein
MSSSTSQPPVPEPHGTIDWRRLGIDVAVALGLLLALALVFAWEKRSASLDRGSAIHSGKVEVRINETQTTAEQPLRLAVTEPEYDDMGKLLDTLGKGYRHTTIPYDDLLVPERLSPYDVVFLTCGGVPREWLGNRIRGPERRGAGVFRAREEIVTALNKSLRQYVGHGGTLYVSDLHFELLGIAFPELVDRAKAGRGVVESIRAEVVDSGLQKWLGSNIELRFEMPAWRPAAFTGQDVTTYLRGTYKRMSGGEDVVPLLVTFPFQEGMVVFTSFHNEAQNNELELKLLRYLVFTTVTATEEEKIKRTLVQGGFSPQERGILRPLTERKDVTETYDCPKGGHLQFALGFRDQGATLRLTAVGPDGKRYEESGTKSFTLDIPHAAPGQWKYTITPVKIPYLNFPFTLTIGEKQ